MKNLIHFLSAAAFMLFFSSTVFAKHTLVYIDSDRGRIGVELFDNEAPITVKNFLHYADTRFYEQTIFHRLIPTFVLQGGGLTAGMRLKPTAPPIKNEAAVGLKNLRGTLAMARTSAIDSATSQFFINLVDNPRLDHTDDTPAGFGYAVFGKIVSGSEVIGKILNEPTHNVPPYSNVPVTPIIIKSVTRASAGM